MQKVRVVKWGSSLAVRIPKAVVERASLKEDDPIFIEVLDERVRLRPADKVPTLEELVAKITPENCHEEMKCGPAVGKEIIGW
jgi:antitoxin MazE